MELDVKVLKMYEFKRNIRLCTMFSPFATCFGTVFGSVSSGLPSALIRLVYRNQRQLFNCLQHRWDQQLEVATCDVWLEGSAWSKVSQSVVNRQFGSCYIKTLLYLPFKKQNQSLLEK